MSFTVSVRPTEPLEAKLNDGKDIPLPQECEHNSKVIHTLLQYADRLLPKFTSLSDDEVKRIADGVAYLLRPDLILQGRTGMGPQPLAVPTPQMYGEDGIQVHISNDPEELNPEWKIPTQYASIGGEFYRCFSAVLNWMPGMIKRLDPTGDQGPSFRLADVTAFLLYPPDLTDYHYTATERQRFHGTLRREMRGG